MSFTEFNQRDRMRIYIRDMATAVAVSTHKDALNEAQIPEHIVAEVAALAAQIAIEKYDAENRVIVAQAKSFERMMADRVAENGGDKAVCWDLNHEIYKLMEQPK